MKSIRSWMTQHEMLVKGIGATIILFVVLFVIMDWVVMPLYTQAGRTRTLPDVTGQTYEEASRILKSSGFRIIRDREIADAKHPAGIVISQNPFPLAQVKLGRRIYVTVSSGGRMITVPKVIGTSEKDAAFVLKQAGLETGEMTYEYQSYYPVGVVCDQSVPEQMEVLEKTPVDLHVSLGPVPSRFVVPDVTGKTLESAKRTLMLAGLRLGAVGYEVKNDTIPDVVIYQFIPPGRETQQDMTVDVTVSKIDTSVHAPQDSIR
jgi:eukaryotic-like serine/threonine-protein kinase